MKEPNISNFHWAGVVALIVAVAAWRAFVADGTTSLLANFTPIGAIALFAGSYFHNRVWRYFFPLAILFLSDLFLTRSIVNTSFLYAGWLWVYLAFVLTIYLGETISQKIKFSTVAAASIGSALVHWLLSDFGFWLTGGINVISGAPFEKTLSGLLICYSLGFPFFLKLASSTLLYSLLMYGGYSFLRTFSTNRAISLEAK